MQINAYTTLPATFEVFHDLEDGTSEPVLGNEDHAEAVQIARHLSWENKTNAYSVRLNGCIVSHVAWSRITSAPDDDSFVAVFEAISR